MSSLILRKYSLHIFVVCKTKIKFIHVLRKCRRKPNLGLCIVERNIQHCKKHEMPRSAPWKLKDQTSSSVRKLDAASHEIFDSVNIFFCKHRSGQP